MSDMEWADAMMEISAVHHIKDEFRNSDYRLAVEIIRLRRKLGEPICPHYAPLRTNTHVEDDDLPF